MLADSLRIEQKDKLIAEDLADQRLMNQLFLRLVSKKKRFTNVDFKYCIFDSCYLRNCVFDSCDFTGCRFLGTNMHGSSFVGCRFDYAIFERTLVDPDLLDSGCPGPENLRMRFARSLRMNYQQLGDARSANKAIRVELQASEDYLFKSWNSKESYYRKKYGGPKRAAAFLEWASFKFLDFVWGNGESPIKLMRSVILVLVGIALLDAVAFRNIESVGSLLSAVSDSPPIFFGAITPTNYPAWALTTILLLRLVAFGLFMSIIIKRLNRR
jgi:hypothetical protein